MDSDVAVGYGTTTPAFWISRFDDMGPNREVHIAFTAASVDEVKAYAAATELGAEALHEPRLWPEYHEHYYGALAA